MKGRINMGLSTESTAIFGYVIIAIINILTVANFFKAIIQRKPLDAIMAFCTLVFFVFMDSAVYFGGSADVNAATRYEFYEAGKYYLSSHGNYTEVSYQTFTYMRVVEIVGIVAFVFAFLTAIVKNKNETGKFFGR